jgi:hypothetical protein
MTRGIDAKTLGSMRAAVGVLSPSTCKIGVYSDGTADETGKPTQIWTYGDILKCMSREPTAREIEAWGQIGKLDGMVFLPLGTTIGKRDRVHVLTSWGSTFDIYFEVIGEPVVGPVQVQVGVSKVTVTSKV